MPGLADTKKYSVLGSRLPSFLLRTSSSSASVSKRSKAFSSSVNAYFSFPLKVLTSPLTFASSSDSVLAVSKLPVAWTPLTVNSFLSFKP